MVTDQQVIFFYYSISSLSHRSCSLNFCLLCPRRVLFFHFYCVSIFIEYKDEIYEEDLKEGWTFLGRKKVHMILLLLCFIQMGYIVCHFYCNTITLIHSNP